jgi:Opacity protein and related surface antigens
MRKVFGVVAASAVVFGLASVANAADAIDEVPLAPEAVDVSVPGGWEGGYLGVKGTHQWGKVKAGQHYDARGLGAGVYGGYNLQSDKIVYGGELDVNYSGIDSKHNGVTTKQRVNGALRARIGYDLDPVLVYGAAGVAATNLKARDARSADDNNHFGLTVGAGAEAKITDSIVGRAEYRFTDYQNQTFDLRSGATDRGLKEHQVNVGIGVRF